MMRKKLVLSCCYLLLLAGIPAMGETIRVKATAPIVVEAVSSGQQRRTLPWSDQTVRATAGFKLLAPGAADGETGLTPGLAAARSRLEAREAARRNLARQIAQLPASEPAPGDIRNLSLLEFAERRPAVTQAIEKAIDEATEEVSIGQDQNAVLELRMPLKELAQSVLDFGGGFATSPELVGREGSRQRAARLAEQKAQADLIQQLLRREVQEGLTFGDWVQREPRNRERLLEALRKARKTANRAEEEDGAEEWLVELRFDADPLRKEIRREEREARKRLSRMQ